ncbi:HNH endonuclease, partial [Rhodococcus sp. MALMAid1271]
MSEGRFCVDPELRAYLEALFSKAAKPGVNNPADPTSVVHDDTDSTSSASSTPEPEPTSGPTDNGDARLWDDTTPEDTAESSNSADSSNTAESSNSGDDETTATAARDAAAARDPRSQRERCHDALKLALRHTLAS